MNLSQVQNIQYLFYNLYSDSSKKLVVKYNGELITANFFNIGKYYEPVLLNVEDESRNIAFRDQFKNLRQVFLASLSTYETTRNFLEKNQELILVKIIELIKTKSYDIQENIIYDVHFLNNDMKYDFYLVSDADSFEVVSLTD